MGHSPIETQQTFQMEAGIAQWKNVNKNYKRECLMVDMR